MADRVRGKIKSFDIKSSTGMITQNNGPDLFFFPSDVQGQRSGSFNQGEEVEFEVSKGEKRMMAKNITLL